MPTLLEQARRQAKGQPPLDIEWNDLTVGNSTFTLEYPHTKLIGRAKPEDIVFSYAFTRKGNKDRCNLCTMWFDKKSVTYRVPNHRIIELQKLWGYVRTGRRYQSASFLYGMSPICKMCSQYFETDLEKSMVGTSLCSPKSKENNIFNSHIARHNIAVNCRTYQSSEVDGYISSYCITPPYFYGSKTRRESDPWWEIDLGQSCHIHSVAVTLRGTSQQTLHVNCLLFRGPVGFENPFLDSVIGKSLHHQTFDVTSEYEVKEQTITWTLPPDSIAGAFRVQLRGLHTLYIIQVQIFQGDHILQSENTPAAQSMREMDAALREESFAAIPHTALTKLRTDKALHAKRPSTTEKLSPISLKQIRNQVTDLHDKFQTRNQAINEWQAQAEMAASYFTYDELLVLRDLIFSPAVASCSSSPRKTYIRAQDMTTTALTEYFPRCTLSSFYTNLKLICAYVQSIQQRSKELDLLRNSDIFAFMADDNNIILNRYLHHLIYAQEHWMQPGLRNHSMSRSSVRSVSDDLNWSQFLMIMRLICLHQVADIPEFVFGVTDDLHLLAPLRSRVLSADSDSVSTPSSTNPSSPSKSPVLQRGLSTASHHSDAPQSARIATANTGRRMASVQPFALTTPATLEKQESKFLESYEFSTTSRPATMRSSRLPHSPSLAEKFKNVEGPWGKIPMANFAHSQFKLDRIAARLGKDIAPIPLSASGRRLPPPTAPEPSTEITERALQRQGSSVTIATSVKEPALPRTISALSDVDEQTDTSPASLDTKPPLKASATEVRFTRQMSVDSASTYTRDIPFKWDNEDTDKYKKTCTLCTQQFPKHSLESKVMLKHIITLRKSWDPSLVTKFDGHLEQGLSLFNLAPVCLFCAQYFDPDFPDGVCAPTRQIKQEVTQSSTETLLLPPKGFIQFYDGRYIGMRAAGDILHNAETQELRARAKKALQISRDIKQGLV